MQHYGLLDQDAATRRYRAGAMLAQAVRAGMAATPLDDACRAVLARLSDDSGLTAYLSTLNQRETVVLQRLNGSHPVQVLSPPGSRRAASGTAMGRALLSRLSEAEFQALYGADADQPLPTEGRDCPATVGDLARLVAQTRADHCGVAIDQAMPGIGGGGRRARPRHRRTARPVLVLRFLSGRCRPRRALARVGAAAGGGAGPRTERSLLAGLNAFRPTDASAPPDTQKIPLRKSST
jgi:DNA-binding IclR family transcriptional regulator